MFTSLIYVTARCGHIICDASLLDSTQFARVIQHHGYSIVDRVECFGGNLKPQERPLAPKSSIFYNAHHSPIGAFASFTLGAKGARGGLGIELPQPANHNVYIGLQSVDGEFIDMLPFYAGAGQDDPAARFQVEQVADEGIKEARTTVATPKLRAFHDSEISRELLACTDEWRAGDLVVRIISPVTPLPDPSISVVGAIKLAVLPAILVEVEVDNRINSDARKAIFGYVGADPYSAMRRLDDTMPGYAGVGQGTQTAIVAQSNDVGSALGFSVDDILAIDNPDNCKFGLGSTGLLTAIAAPGQISKFRFAVCFYRGGCVTAGLATSYLYTRYFQDIEEVASYALDHFEQLRVMAAGSDMRFAPAHLSQDQRWMIAHSVRSYYGSTQLLDSDGDPLWVVNEGEYRMMNTFDLTVDQLFFEMMLNPWTVRNVLGQFVERYSYEDDVTEPGSDAHHPGGISFTHDMGIGNVFSRPGYSSYEKFGLRGCFSHMTHEQLVNWVLCATVYVEGTGDTNWCDRHLGVLQECLKSMVNRDDYRAEARNGVMSLESTRTSGGAEITTYDSLDESLGQARSNTYLAVKCWAAYVALHHILHKYGLGEVAAVAHRQAKLCAATIIAAARDDGQLPALLEGNHPSRIIPAIEGLIFPLHTGCSGILGTEGEFAQLAEVLRKHLRAVLIPGVCLFDDGGWKLSSTAKNSWLSKIYLCQHVARKVLNVNGDEVTKSADGAHVQWLQDEANGYWAWSDQMVAGVAMASRYYPRGVTSCLWLNEG